MIKGIGVDIVEIDRLRTAVQKWGERFLKKIFNAAEISYCSSKKNMFQCLAARFAAKEAFIKAWSDLGTGGPMPGLTDIVVLNQRSGKPYITIEKNFSPPCFISLTLSHERHYAVAVVLLETPEK
jgi:holo-[acyl-carrier protein] synthase